MIEEIWKQVPDWPTYEVSNFGNLRNWKGARGKLRFPRYVKGFGRKGYLAFNLSEGNGKRSELWSAHRLVAYMFLPTNDTSLHVAHLDGNKQNNCVSNLKWCSAKENNSHKKTHGTHQARENHPRAKLCESAIFAIKKLYKTGSFSQRDIAKLFNLSQAHTQKIISGKAWTYEKEKNNKK